MMTEAKKQIVKDFLASLGIEHKGDTFMVKVSRDSIANKVEGKTPEESNSNLMTLLQEQAKDQPRFYWAMRDNNWLWIDHVHMKRD